MYTGIIETGTLCRLAENDRVAILQIFDETRVIVENLLSSMLKYHHTNKD